MAGARDFLLACMEDLLQAMPENDAPASDGVRLAEG